MEHGGALEDAFTNLGMGHRPGAVHANHIADRGSGAVGRVHPAPPCGSTHDCLLSWVHGLENLGRLSHMSHLFI